MRIDAGQLLVHLTADLLNSGWDSATDHYPGETKKQFAMTHLTKSILKKFEDCPSDDADARALAKFLDINESCRQFTWDPSRFSELEAIAIGEAKDFIYRFFYLDLYDEHAKVLHVLNTVDITNNFDLGPGSNIGAYSNDFLSKVGTSVLCGTNSALFDFFKQAIELNPLWSDVELIRSDARGESIVRGSRLCFVPKTTEISRTICTEPLLNMYFQKGIGKCLEKRLRQVCGIDLTRQPIYNRNLAQRGSKHGEFGTIDLTSASDSMSLGLVRALFPSQVVSWLELARSPVTILPDGTEVELHMVSSMGNAYTFPLQTLLFFSLVYGAYRALDIKIEKPSQHSPGNLAVFGDDIICVTKAYGLVCKLLSLTGFQVNVDKSFNDGFFRESCGSDYFMGHDVRGVYIRHLRDVCDRYSAINRLNVWSAKHWIPLPLTVSYLLKGIRLMPIPFYESDIGGVKVPSSLLRQTKRCKYTGSIKYQYRSVVVREISVSDVESSPPKIKGWIDNPPAVLLAALAGTLRSGKIAPRLQKRFTRVRTKITPCWDYFGADHHVNDGFCYDWKVMTELNLTF